MSADSKRLMKRCLAAALGLLILSCPGCERGSGRDGFTEEVTAVDSAPDPLSNRLEGLPGEIYSSQTDSLIHWQPWTKETLELAKDSGRLVLALVALPQQPSYREIIRKMERNQSTVREINDFYVPVLVDGDAVREFGILTVELCAEIGSVLQLPLMVWLTPDGNPVAWIPLPSGQTASVSELFSQSHQMVGRMWNEDPGYVSQNSMMDQENRKKRIEGRRTDRELSISRETDSLRALRQLTSLYDPLSRTFDEAGGLFPCGALDLLSAGARMEGIPADLKEKCRMVLGFLLDDLLVSPMFDPLDGGVFSSSSGSTWELPGFNRNCSMQAKAAVSLFDAYEATGDTRALDRALGILEFIENEYATPEGLYGLGTGTAEVTEKWLWRVEDLEEILTPEELAVWTVATGIKEMGNLPSEVDPLREFFRANSISFRKSPAELALAFNESVENVNALLDSAGRKLLKVRSERMKYPAIALEANAAATFRVVSAFASAYRITGDKGYLEKAVNTLQKAKDRFSYGPRLRLYGSDAPENLVTGRAFLYALALQSALDVAAVSLDETWLMWSDDLGTTAAELFAAKGYLREYPADTDPMNLPISDLVMVFDESTAGLLSMSESRMASLGRPLLPQLAKKAAVLPMSAINTPIMHTDVIQGALMKEYGVTYVYGAEVSDESRKLMTRRPLKGVNRRAAGQDSGVESDAILKIQAGRKAVLVTDLRGDLDPALRNDPK